LLTKLKRQIEKILTGEAEAAHRVGLTPNRISALGIGLVVLSALSYFAWHSQTAYLILAAVLLLLSGFCDALDGVVARVYQQTTVFGGFLDSVLDRYADALIFASIIISNLCETIWGLIALVGALLVSYTRARAEAAGTKMESIGIAERPERIIILVVATVVAAFWQPITTMNWGIILLAILTNLTVLQRGISFYNESKKKGNP
jgi:archaetidylinositol phosphate synthase